MINEDGITAVRKHIFRATTLNLFDTNFFSLGLLINLIYFIYLVVENNPQLGLDAFTSLATQNKDSIYHT